ncbi:MAG: hypothetical protein ACFFG0_03865 [Candidatus Thorarchaeota archaeon]
MKNKNCKGCSIRHHLTCGIEVYERIFNLDSCPCKTCLVKATCKVDFMCKERISYRLTIINRGVK